MVTDIIYNEFNLTGMKKLDDNSVNCCVTSPPYFGLRDYGCPSVTFSDGWSGEHGQEETVELYVNHEVEIFREVKRILRDDGTLWINIGDSYAGSGKGAWANKDGGQKEVYIPDPDSPQCKIKKVPDGLKPKDLIGIPWRVAFALQADGWYLRQDIIWAKPNPMPESVTDRCTKSHEYIFLLSKSEKYYFDSEAIKEPCLTFDNSVRDRDSSRLNNVPGRTHEGGLKTNSYTMRNKRDVWTVATKPFKESHFATFPPELIIPCILAGCPHDGVVIDPFMGSGTTGMVAKQYNRHYIGYELNPEYAKMSEKRIHDNTMQNNLF